MEQKPVFWVIDRIEGEYAIIDTGSERVQVARSALPPDVREGSVLRLTSDPEEEGRRKKRIRSLFDRLKVD